MASTSALNLTTTLRSDFVLSHNGHFGLEGRGEGVQKGVTPPPSSYGVRTFQNLPGNGVGRPIKPHLRCASSS